MTRLTVDLPALADLVDRMQLFQDHLSRAERDVDRRVRGLHATWTGDAAAAQAAAHAKWARAAADLAQSLAALRAVVATAHGNYTAAARTNRQMWAR